MRKLSLLVLALFMVLSFVVGCGQSSEGGNLIIPDEYKTGISVSTFADTWSQTEDGLDLTGNIIFYGDEGEYTVISEYLSGLKVSPADNSGNFTPDFRFISNDSSKNSYDFVFTEDNKLILRDPDGICTQVDISESEYYGLKEYIGEIRLGQSVSQMVGAYSSERELTAEDLEIFAEAMIEQTGITYEPLMVSTQIVAGVNYRFTATATTDEPGAEPSTVYIFIFQPLGDSPPELVDILPEQAD